MAKLRTTVVVDDGTAASLYISHASSVMQNRSIYDDVIYEYLVLFTLINNGKRFESLMT
jgi:hypothetical protein